MPELRKDPVHGRWVIMGTERPSRADDFAPLDPPSAPGPCSLCDGHETETPPELLAYRALLGANPNTPGWRVRVVPSRFPTFRVEGEIAPRGLGLYDLMNAIGAHEIVVESPHHEARLTTLSLDAVEDLVHAFQARMIDLRRDPRIRSVRVFKSSTPALPGVGHSYSQVIATPTIPEDLTAALVQARAYHDYRERCLFCDVVDQETEDGRRLVVDDDGMIAFVPFAAATPFEVWILPRRHAAAYEHMTASDRTNLARILSTLLQRIDRALGAVGIAFVVHTAPVGDELAPFFHWHLQLQVRVGCRATPLVDNGYASNPLLPEDAARLLRPGESS